LENLGDPEPVRIGSEIILSCYSRWHFESDSIGLGRYVIALVLGGLTLRNSDIRDCTPHIDQTDIIVVSLWVVEELENLGYPKLARILEGFWECKSFESIIHLFEMI
jgi:hypothetical protein